MRLFVALAAVVTLHAADYDLLIRNARIVDGTGNAWYRGDIGVKAGKIAAIGKLDNKTADRTIDAANRVASPGFIDVHTHIEGTVNQVPRGDNYLLDGVTTVVTGNCGGSVIKVADWFQNLEKTGIGLNIATLIGHNGVRSEVMGTANRLATPEEITRMQAIVDKAMAEGAVGFSTGLIYIPGTYSNTDEVVALARAAARYGGVYASHMRDEGERVIDAINEAVTVGKETGLRVQLSHFKIDTPRIWGYSEKTLALVEDYRKQGVDVVVDQYPYDRSSTNLGITLPTWALADGPAKVNERLKDPATRAKIAAEMKEIVTKLGHKDYSYATVAGFASNKEYEGKTISEINVMKGRAKTLDNEVQTILDMMAQGFAQMVYHSMGAADVERIMRYPNTAVASDGGIRVFGQGMPHPRSYGTNARTLAEWVRTRKVLTLEDAVRRMTSLPARTFGFKDRGLLREGAAADILLFDPAKVQDKSTFAQPHQFSEGFDYVIVNGKVSVDSGKLTESRNGMILRRAS
ncbi:aminoacylase [Bryobacterales bacterium F-183]|nr:aminoacylase [Bryobacterales bacterium F-183]